MYEELCEKLLSIIPDIRWDRDSVEAIHQAVSILQTLSSLADRKEDSFSDV